MQKLRSRSDARARAAFEIIDGKGNHVTFCRRRAECRQSIAQFLAVPPQDLDRFKTTGQARWWGRKSFEAYERHGRIYEIVKARRKIQRRPGRKPRCP